MQAAGRTRLAHDLGGVSIEWLVRYDRDRLAWLAENQGRLSLMAEMPVGECLHSARGPA